MLEGKSPQVPPTGTGAKSESGFKDTNNETTLLESAVVSLDSDGKPMKCDNQQLVKEIRWWLGGELLVLYTCVDQYLHYAGILLIIFWSTDARGLNAVNPLPEHVRSVVLNVTEDDLVNTIDWNCVEQQLLMRTSIPGSP